MLLPYHILFPTHTMEQALRGNVVREEQSKQPCTTTAFQVRRIDFEKIEAREEANRLPRALWLLFRNLREPLNRYV